MRTLFVLEYTQWFKVKGKHDKWMLGYLKNQNNKNRRLTNIPFDNDCVDTRLCTISLNNIKSNPVIVRNFLNIGICYLLL